MVADRPVGVIPAFTRQRSFGDAGVEICASRGSPGDGERGACQEVAYKESVSRLWSEDLVHNQRIDEPKRGMVVRQRQAANDGKPVALPRTDRTFIRADDEVELHRAKAAVLGMNERMLQHTARHAPALGAGHGHEAAVGYMIASPKLVSADVVRPEDITALVSDKNFVGR